MRRTKLFRAALLTLALLLLLGGASGAAFADSADDSAAVGWSVSAKDGEGKDVTLSSAEEVAEKLGEGFALDCGKDGQGAPITAPTVADLRRAGIKITPPAGYTIGSVLLVAEGGEPASGSRSLLSLASPSLAGGNAVTLPAAIFADDYDAAAVGCVFNGSADKYILQIVLDRVAPAEQITLQYGAGTMASSLGDTALVSGGNTAVFPLSSGAASGQIASLDTAVADTALRSFGKRFTGWKLVLPNGASTLLAGGESFSLSCSAALEAQWEDVIVFTFTGGEKFYDGTPLIGSYSQIGRVKDGDELTIPEDALTLSRTDAGESNATLDLSRVSVTRGGTDVTAEYEFAVIPAALRVVQRGVTFTVADVNCEYDGSAHAPAAYSVSAGELVKGHSASAVYSGQQTLPGSSTGSAVFTIRDENGSNVTANYNVSVINATISVAVRSEKQPLTVTVRDVEKEYDGSTELKAEYSLSSGSLFGSDRLVAQSFSGSVSGVGTGSVEGSFAVYNAETDVSDNYEITVVPGELTIKPRALVLTADSAEKAFDGTPLTKDGFTLTSGTLAADHSVTAAVTGSQTEAGSSPNKIGEASVKVTDKDGGDVTALYSFRLEDGVLTVKARPITLTALSASKSYDGQPLTSDGFQISSGELVSGHEVTASVTGSQTDPGSSANVIEKNSVKVTDASGKDVTANYEFSLVDGLITVTARSEKQPLTVTIQDVEKEYDGSADVKADYSLSSGSLFGSDRLVAQSFSGSISGVGTGSVEGSFAVYSAQKDMSDNYAITVVPGKLRIKPRALVLTADSAQKEYDGAPLTKDGFTLTSGTLAAGHSITASVIGSQTEVGSSANVIEKSSVKITDASGKDVTANYTFSLVDGSITVTTRSKGTPLTVTIQDVEKDYDGSADVKAEFSLTSGSLFSGDRLVAQSFSGSISGAGTGSVEGSFAVYNGETDVSGNYEITVVPGKLTIKPRALVLTADSAKKEYDGEPLVSESCQISAGELVDGHKLTASVTGSQTVPGSSANVIGKSSVKITDASGKDVTANYTLSLVDGSITVTARSKKAPLTVTIKDTQKEYDGGTDVNAEYSLSSGSLLGSDRLAAQSFSGSISSVGTGSVKGSFTVFNGETDVSENYEISVVPGKLTIKPRALVLTADSAEKAFDGTPLTKDGFTLTSGTLMADHLVTATVTGSQTEVGSSANKIGAATVKVTDKDGKNVTGLYSIRLVDGTLTVKSVSAPTAITITMKDAEKVYDGTALSSKEYTISSGSLAEGDTLVLGTVTGEQTDAGSSSVTAAFTVKNGEKDVTSMYTITVVSGKLTVKERPITVTAASASKVFDGRALTANSYQISTGELVKGHKLTASVTGSQTALGSSANIVDKSSVKITDASGKDVTANYSVTTAAGTLTVNRDPVTAITLTVGDGSKVYDGKPYRFIDADIRVSSGSLPAGYKIEATFNPEAPVDVGKYDVTIKSVTIRNAAGADVTSQFNITRAKGSFTITARPLVIETKAANKVYDGTALTERSTPTITGRAEGHQVTLRITGSQTKVGSSENTVADVKITDKESGANVTKNYAISYQYGLLTVSEAVEGSAEAGSYKWVNGSSGTLYIRFDHAYDGFEGLQVDGKDVDRSNYTSSSGSTDIWLKSAYLNTLSSGTHTLTAKYAGGETVKTSFSVEGKRTTRTGDNSRLGLWLLILATALVAFFAAAWYLFLGKNRRWKKKSAKKNK